MEYQKHVFDFSGGKDSTALFLNALEHGVPRESIELHHHLVDGREGSNLFDWKITEDYCRKFAAAFGVKIYFSWRKHGMEGEMTRNNERIKPAMWENPDGSISAKGGTDGGFSTRKMFPQVGMDQSVRWCSSCLKKDVGTRLINNSERFYEIQTAVYSGERGEESPNRAKYDLLKPDYSDNRDGRTATKRHVDRLHSLRDWKEEEVWEIIERWKVRVHPCYYLGWGRCSCRFCIFGNPNQFQSARELDPNGFERLVAYEKEFGKTMKRDKPLDLFADKGKSYEALNDPKNAELKAIIMGGDYDLPIFMEDWFLPAGAYGEADGPS